MKGKRRFCGGVTPPTQQDISKGVPASGSNNDNEPSVVVPNQVNSKLISLVLQLVCLWVLN